MYKTLLKPVTVLVALSMILFVFGTAVSFASTAEPSSEISVRKHYEFYLNQKNLNRVEAESAAADNARAEAIAVCRSKGGKPPWWLEEYLSSSNGGAYCEMKFGANVGYFWSCDATFQLTCTYPKAKKAAIEDGHAPHAGGLTPGFAGFGIKQSPRYPKTTGAF